MEKNLEMRKLWSFYTPERCNLKIHPKLQKEIHLNQTPQTILGVIFSWIWVILGYIFTDCTMVNHHLGFAYRDEQSWAARISIFPTKLGAKGRNMVRVVRTNQP